MSEIEKAREFAKDFVNKHPILVEEVYNYLDLMLENIEEGDSSQNELQLFMGACEDLLKD
jgi:hypothetical protein